MQWTTRNPNQQTDIKISKNVKRPVVASRTQSVCPLYDQVKSSTCEDEKNFGYGYVEV